MIGLRQEREPVKRNAQSRVRPFAVLAGLAVAALTVWLTVQLEVVNGSQIYFSTTSVAIIPLAIMFVIQFANSALRRVRPRVALNATELVCIYSMGATALFVAAFDCLQGLISTLAYAPRFPVSNPAVRETLLSALPSWATVRDPATLSSYFRGGGDVFTDFRWQVWLMPILFWTAFAIVLLATLILVARIMEGYWSKHQRLSFPLSELPVALTDPDSEIRSAVNFRIGFLVGGLLLLLPALHHEWPAFPSSGIPLSRANAVDIGSLFQYPPWNAIGSLPFFVSPFIVGLAFMSPLDMQFSFWFFVILWRLLLVAVSAAGYQPTGFWQINGTVPYAGEQTFGALVFFGAFSIWQARKWIATGWRGIFNRKLAGADGSEIEPGVYVGAAVGLVALIGMETALGLNPILAASFVAIFVIVSVAVARIRAEVGAPIHDFWMLGPDFVLPALLPAGMLTSRALGALSLNHWFAETLRANLLAVGSENFRVASRVGARARPVIFAMVGGAAFAVVIFFFHYMQVAYRQGAEVGMHGYTASGLSQRTIQHLSDWLTNPSSLGEGSWAAVGVGAFIAYLLTFARCLAPSFPLHPAGFALSTRWAGAMLWASFLVAWLLKWTVLRIGGLRLYRFVAALMMGIVAGQLIVGVGWASADLLFHRPIFGFCDH